MDLFSFGKLKSLGAGLLAVSVSAPAYAHSPYLSYKTPWIGPDGGNWTLALINGDSILAPTIDPYRPVVVNPDGKVVAIGELNNAALPFCFTPQDRRFVTYDGVLKPDPTTFGPPRAPNFYPEHLDTYGFDYKPAADRVAFQPYGLRHSSLTSMEQMKVWGLVIAAAPIFSALFLAPLLIATFLFGAGLVATIFGAQAERKIRTATLLLGASIILLSTVYYIAATTVMAMVAAAAGLVIRGVISGVKT